MSVLRNCMIGVLLCSATVIGLTACSDDEPEPIAQEELYILNEKSNTLSIYMVPGLERHEPDIAMASPAPHHLHFDVSHIFYFVVSRTQGGFVHKYDVETNDHLATSTIAHFFTGVATSPDAQHVYVTDFGQDITQRTKMYILHMQDLSVVDSITCGSQPHFINMTSDGETVILVNTGSDELTYYYPNGNPEDNVVNAKIDPDDPAPLGQPVLSPYCIAIADDDSLAYVCCRKTKWPGQSAIFVVDIINRQTIDTILVPFLNRSGSGTNYQMGLCMLLEDRYLAVTTQDGNSLLLVDVTDGSYEEAVFQHDVAFGVTATSDEKHMYVTVNNGINPSTPGWVYEIERDGGSMTVMDSVEVGLLPNGIHVKPGAHVHEH